MLDIKHLINNKSKYLDLLNRKNFNLKEDLEFIEKNYFKYLESLKKEEQINLELNLISKQIKKEKEPKEKKELIQKASKVSSESKNLKIETKKYFDIFNERLSYIPNTPFEDVSIGTDEKDNKIISVHLSENKKTNIKTNYWDFILKNNLVYEEEVKNISGSRFVIYKQKLALLGRALEQFMIEHNIENGFELVEAPVIVNERMLFNTSNLPKFKDDLFKIEGMNNYLIPTSEVTLTNLVSNKILDEKKLPLNFTSYSLCFRKEAGSAGKDNKGIFRLHQFKKVEIVKIGKPENQNEDFLLMEKNISSILKKLGLPYRKVELCTGDMSFGSKKTIDFEVWIPSENKYKEISSLSIMGDFQSRRMKTRYSDPSSGNKVFPFTYNGSSLALDRTIISLIENNLNENGEFVIPKVLHKYLNFYKI